MKARVLVLYGYGINCDHELQHGFELAGAVAERVHVNQLIADERSLKDFNILALPGGFSFGDDIAAGKVLATKFRHNLEQPLQEFIAGGNLVIGICNGFQSMVKLGVLPGFGSDYRTQRVTLTSNDSGKFEDRWVCLEFLDSNCAFTAGIDEMYLPVRHGEGKFVPANDEVLQRLYENGQVVARYIGPDGKQNPAYPWNPNGSVDAIAAVCDQTGRIFGIMPHPEAYLYPTNEPFWTRRESKGKGPRYGQGLRILKNGVDYAVRS